MEHMDLWNEKADYYKDDEISLKTAERLMAATVVFGETPQYGDLDSLGIKTDYLFRSQREQHAKGEYVTQNFKGFGIGNSLSYDNMINQSPADPMPVSIVPFNRLPSEAPVYRLPNYQPLPGPEYIIQKIINFTIGSWLEKIQKKRFETIEILNSMPLTKSWHTFVRDYEQTTGKKYIPNEEESRVFRACNAVNFVTILSIIPVSIYSFFYVKNKYSGYGFLRQRLFPLIGAYIGGLFTFYTTLPLKNYTILSLINNLPSDNGPLGGIAHAIRLNNEYTSAMKLNKTLDYYRTQLEECGLNYGFLKSVYAPVPVPELKEVKIIIPISQNKNVS